MSAFVREAAASGVTMSEQDLTREMNRTGAEPLLPIEKKTDRLERRT